MRDTLDSIVSPAVRDTLIAEALELGKLDALPTSAVGFREFLQGPLVTTLERALGERLGRAVAAELELLTERLPRSRSSSVPERSSSSQPRPPANPPEPRRSKPRSRPPVALTRPETPQARGQFAAEEPITRPGFKSPEEAARSTSPTVPVPLASPKPPSSDDFPSGTARALGIASPPPARPGSAAELEVARVLIVTRDPDFSRRFSAWFDERAEVIRVASLTELLVSAGGITAGRLVVLFDAFAPVTRATSLAAIQEELPASTRIVIWGGLLDRTVELTRLFPRVREWLVCSEQAPLEDVVDCCGVSAG